MSVFQKLKGTFQNAQQGFVDGLRAVTLLDAHLKSEQLQHIKSKEINLDVGADLLHEYQKVWSGIQNETKLCSKKAEGVDTILAPMFVLWDKRGETIAAFEEEVKSIPGILSTMKDMHTLLETIRQDFSVVESSIAMLENVCEEIDLKKSMEEETRKLFYYRQMKEKETEKIKVKLALEHARRMQDIESSKSMKMKERQEAFTSAFEEDVDYYRTHGHSESKLVTEFPKVTSLSQINIVEDQKELDTFLGPQTEDEEPEETAAEEQYFEDDYTTDFSIKVKEDCPDDEEDDLRRSSTSLSELPDENYEDFSNDENENIVQEKGNYPDSYLVKNVEEENEAQDEMLKESEEGSEKELEPGDKRHSIETKEEGKEDLCKENDSESNLESKNSTVDEVET